MLEQLRSQCARGGHTGLPRDALGTLVAKRLDHLVGELGIEREGHVGHAQDGLGGGDGLGAERSAVCFFGVHHLGRWEADVRSDDDQRRATGLFNGRPSRRLQGVEIVGLFAEINHVPSVGGEARGRIVAQR